MQIMVRSTIFLYNLPLKRLAIGPLFEQTSIPLTQGSFLQNLVEANPKVLEKKNLLKCIFSMLPLSLLEKRCGP